ncbi:carbon-nitrogen hydrolase family protein [Rhodococcus artemisiae]|uniref:Carbon-nitrogen hydrolase family protein n=1 Tax=Rhodococcus artemisiae TaxID=714159 RepID=A0ABU7LFL5_9NOCA|nr:carbon-nitrogen hydrolase family protein [Rhodococcus artemisiae]MEE2060349.1 carbon-nitrogen hydrolase family protein [Rhodococcus artemisiae]
MTTASRSLKVGLTQWHATTDIDGNLEVALRLIERAAADGASVVVLPENGLMLGTGLQMREAALSIDAAPVVALCTLARRLGVVVVLGGMKNRVADQVFNSALVIDTSGEVVVRYDKLHLFDANIGGQSFEASSVERPGDRLVVVEIDGIKVGLTICYDVRFPEMFRALAGAGAEVLLVPAAFTQTTGEAHWHTLLRARAIENHAFVVAPATVHSPTPDHTDAFVTYGHALAVGPWGEVLADLEESAEAVQVVELDLGEVDRARAKLPVLAGRRDPRVYAAEPHIARISTEQKELAR